MWFWFEGMVDLFFYIDLVLNFFTAHEVSTYKCSCRDIDRGNQLAAAATGAALAAWRFGAHVGIKVQPLLLTHHPQPAAAAAAACQSDRAAPAQQGSVNRLAT